MQNAAPAKGIAIPRVAGLGLLGWSGGAARVASVERYATALNLSVIAVFLFGTASGQAPHALPP